MDVKTFSPNALSRRLAKGKAAPAGPATPAKTQYSPYNGKKAGSLFKGNRGGVPGVKSTGAARRFKGMKS